MPCQGLLDPKPPESLPTEMLKTTEDLRILRVSNFRSPMNTVCIGTLLPTCKIPLCEYPRQVAAIFQDHHSKLTVHICMCHNVSHMFGGWREMFDGGQNIQRWGGPTVGFSPPFHCMFGGFQEVYANQGRTRTVVLLDYCLVSYKV